MHRRQLLKLLALGVVGHTLDIDRLLWVPGNKTIFIPSESQFHALTVSQIVAIELERVIPKMRKLFEVEDNLFYSKIKGLR